MSHTHKHQNNLQQSCYLKFAVVLVFSYDRKTVRINIHKLVFQELSRVSNPWTIANRYLSNFIQIYMLYHLSTLTESTVKCGLRLQHRISVLFSTTLSHLPRQSHGLPEQLLSADGPWSSWHSHGGCTWTGSMFNRPKNARARW